MILLDTNVLSEFMRPQPAPQVVAWLDGQLAHTLYVSAVNRAEIELGLALMPAGKRQAALVAAARTRSESAPVTMRTSSPPAPAWGGRSAWKTRKSPLSRWSEGCGWQLAIRQISHTLTDCR